MKYLEYIDLTIIREKFNSWFDHFGFTFPETPKPFGVVSNKSGFYIRYSLEYDDIGIPCVKFYIDHSHSGAGFTLLNERGEHKSFEFDDCGDDSSPRLHGLGDWYELKVEDRGAKLHLFWDNSPFSQWYKCSFVAFGIEFNCAEQYMMYMKAVIFDDLQTADKILEAKEPREQKELGRHVKGFNQERWDYLSRKVVYDASRHKFMQNEDLLEQLFTTDDCYLVEASPYDTIWGIGLSEDNPDAKNPEKWRGTNWLGDMLTLLREDIKYNKEKYNL